MQINDDGGCGFDSRVCLSFCEEEEVSAELQSVWTESESKLQLRSEGAADPESAAASWS